MNVTSAAYFADNVMWITVTNTGSQADSVVDIISDADPLANINPALPVSIAPAGSQLFIVSSAGDLRLTPYTVDYLAPENTSSAGIYPES